MLPNWQNRLAVFINERRDKPFSWGRNDCLIFTNDAFRAMRGEGWADDLIGGYGSMRGAKEMLADRRRQFPECENICDLITDRLKVCESMIPPKGCLVAKFTGTAIFGYSLGIMTGRTVAYVGDRGLNFLAYEGESAWLPE